jgi:hypothetical protein
MYKKWVYKTDENKNNYLNFIFFIALTW